MGGNNLADVQRLSIVADPANANGSAFGGIRAGNAVFGGSSGVVGISAANVAVQDVVRIGDVQATGSASPALFFGGNSQFGVVTVTGGDLVNSKTINNAGYRYDLELTQGGDSNGVTLPAQNTYAQLNFTQNPASVAAAIAAATPPASKSLNLTTGVDTTLVGGAADDVFSGSIGTDGLASNGTSLNVSDNLPGAAGTDKLSLTISGTNTAAVTTTGFTLTGVEVLEVSNFETSAFDNTINASQVTGLTNVNLASSSATGATAVTNLRNLVGAGMANGSANLTLSYTDAAVAGASDVQNVTLSGQTGGTLTAGAATGAIETVSIVSSGSANTLTLAVPGAQTINVSGDQNLALTESITNTVNRVNASTLTGNLTYTTDDLLAQSITGGSGNDSFVFGTNFDAADSIDGGAGTSDNLTVGASIASAAALANVTNVERLTLVGGGTQVSLAANVSPTTFNLQGDGAQSLTLSTGYSAATTVNVGAGDTVTAGSATGALTINATESSLATASITAPSSTGTSAVLTDTLNLTTNRRLVDADAAINIGTNGVDRINIIDGGDSALDGLSTSAGFDVKITTGAIGYRLTVDASALDASLVADNATHATAETLTFNGSSAGTASVLDVTGGAAPDSITGGSGNDILRGGAGNDTLTSGLGNDNISGGDGNDTINMGAALTADDTVDGGAGSDTLLVTSLQAGALTNVTNVETLAIGNTPTITINAPVSFATIDVDNGTDAFAQNVTLGTAFTGAVTLLVDAGDRVTNSANVALTVQAQDSSLATVTVTGGTGTDTLNIVPTGSVSVNLAGLVTGVEVINVLDGGDSSTTAGRDASITTGDYAVGATVATTLTVNATELDAGSSADLNENLTLNASGITSPLVRVSVTGGAGNDLLTGSNNNDTLIGGRGDDTLTGGAGNDSISGGDGNDRVVMSTNLTGLDSIDGGSGTNTLSTSGALDDTKLVNVSNIQTIEVDTAVTFGAQATRSGLVTITQVGANPSAVNVADMTAGVTINTHTTNANDQAITGGSGNDTINFGGTQWTSNSSAGLNGDSLTSTDVIAGGLGNDTIVLSNIRGSITPELNLNVGKVTGVETIRLGTASGGVQNATDSATGTAQTIALSVTNIINPVEQTISIDANVITDTNDTVTVQAVGGGVITAAATSFNIRGGAGNDTLFGGNNADTIAGGGGADNITGGGGADVLTGGDGADNFVVEGSLGTARDTITDFASGSDKLKVAISSSAATIDATFKGNVTNAGDASAVMTSAPGQYVFNTTNSTLMIDGVGTAANGLITGDDVQVTLQGATSFSGADIDFTITGATAAQAITAGAGNDTLVYAVVTDLFASNATAALTDSITGGAGTDTVRVNDTNAIDITTTNTWGRAASVEALAVGAANTNTVSIVLHSSAFTAGIRTVDLALDTDANGSNTVNVSAATADQPTTVIGSAGVDNITGGAGADSLNGGAGADVITGGAGADTLVGGTGTDTFVYASAADLFTNSAIVDSISGGDNDDTVRVTDVNAISISATDVWSRASSVQTLAVVAANANAISITLHESAITAGIRTVDLSGDSSATGTNTVNLSNVASTGMTVTGSGGVDQITGGGAADSLSGGAGDDVITGAAGADTVSGGANDDTFVYATAADLFTNNALVDSIAGDAGTDTIRVNAAGFTIASTDIWSRAATVETLQAGSAAASAISVTLDASAFTAGIRTVTLASDTDATGTNVVNVSAATVLEAITVVGSAGPDQVTGGAGADVITGGTGADTLEGGGANDTFVYAAVTDLFANNASGLVDSLVGGAGTDVVRIDANGFTIANTNDWSRAGTVETLSAGSASTSAISITLDATAFTAGIRTVTLASDTDVTGTNTVNVSAASASQEITVVGSAGSDQITGGAGVDSLNGGGGNDTFIYATSAAFIASTANVDAVVDLIDGGADTDTISISGSISIGATNADTLARVSNVERLVAASQSANALTHVVTLGSDTVLSSIRTIDLSADSNAGSSGTVNLTGVTVATTITGVVAGTNTLTGGSAGDVINGGAGADVITGGAGADVIDLTETTAAADTVVFASGDSGTISDSVFDTITGYGLNSDVLDIVGSGAVRANTGGTPVDVKAVVAGATQIDAAVADGIITLTGTNAASVDTLAEWLAVARLVVTTSGESAAFKFGTDTYVFQENGNGDLLIKLTGVTTATSVGTGAGANRIKIG